MRTVLSLVYNKDGEHNPVEVMYNKMQEIKVGEHVKVADWDIPVKVISKLKNFEFNVIGPDGKKYVCEITGIVGTRLYIVMVDQLHDADK